MNRLIGHLKGLRKNRGLQFSWHYLKFNSVKDTFPKYETHLDVACGPGTFIGNFLDNRSVGVDIAKRQISYAKNNYPEFKNQFYQKDVNIEIEDLNKYDVVILAVNHIEYEEFYTGDWISQNQVIFDVKSVIQSDKVLSL